MPQGSTENENTNSEYEFFGSDSSNVISLKPYPNSKKYVYYKQDGTRKYIYATSYPKKMSILSLIGQLLLLLPFISAGIYLFISIFTHLFAPKPLLNDDIGGPYFDDRIGVFEETPALNDVLSGFEARTGISPYIVTIPYSDWVYQESSVNDYARRLYYELFEDQNHLLIVYSEPDSITDRNAFFNTMFDGKYGTNVEAILTDNKYKRLTDELKQELTQYRKKPEQAFCLVFTNAKNYLMKAEMNESDIFTSIMFGVLWNTIVILAISRIIKNFLLRRHNYTLVPQYTGFDPDSYIRDETML